MKGLRFSLAVEPTGALADWLKRTESFWSKRRAPWVRSIGLGSAGLGAAGLGWAGGLGLGAAVMYFFDPATGRRRRRQLHDKGARWSSKTRDMARKGTVDLEQRAQGSVVSAFHRLRENWEGGVPDNVLRERVRAKMGTVVSHPHAVDVWVHDGTVVLSGPILTDEAAPLIRRARRTSGVRAVDDRLERHDSAEGVPALQGGISRLERRGIRRYDWPPGIRLGAAAFGTGLTSVGLMARGLPGGLAAGLGSGLLIRSVANMPLRHLFGATEETDVIDIQKDIRIQAHPQRVFEFVRDFENLPRFMSHLHSVQRRSDNVWHWVADGPAHVSLGWDTVVTEREPGRVLSWVNTPDSHVRTNGTLRVDPADGGTRLEVHLSYNPPAGAVGHVLLALFGSDPKSILDDDLLRLKSLLEEGATTAHDQKVTREQMAQGRAEH